MYSRNPEIMEKHLDTLLKEYNIKRDEREFFKSQFKQSIKTGKTGFDLHRLLLIYYQIFRGEFQYKLALISSHEYGKANHWSRFAYSERIKPFLKSYSSYPNSIQFPFQRSKSLDAQQDYIQSLNEKGYVIPDFKVPRAICSQWIRETFNFQNFLIKDINEKTIASTPLWKSKGIDSEVVTASAYSEDIFSMKYIYELVHSNLLYQIASSYLKTSTIYVANVNLWYTFPSSKPSSESAQLFHYDQAAIRWLKVFIYLSDVTEDNGPHVGVEGSHLPHSKPASLLSKGYRRLVDQEINKYYEKDKIKTFIGGAGTIIIADTNAYHKGLEVQKGYRAILEVNYNSDCISDIIID